jgi:hypothetical protein
MQFKGKSWEYYEAEQIYSKKTILIELFESAGFACSRFADIIFYFIT